MENWRKSSHSGGNGGDCVEVASGNGVLVRDTTDRGGFTLAVPASAWQAFVRAVARSLGLRAPGPRAGSGQAGARHVVACRPVLLKHKIF
jgi:hypothetical protein